MSHPSNARRVSCEARNIECDGTKGSVGCQHSTQAGIEYRSHPVTRYTNSSSPSSTDHHGQNLLGPPGHLHQVALYPTALIGRPTPSIDGASTWPIAPTPGGSKFALADEASVQNLAQGSPAMKQASSSPLAPEPAKTRPTFLDDPDAQGPETIQRGILDRLVPDGQVESNMLTYLTYSAASWMNRFLFEPSRAIQGTKSLILHWLKYDTSQVIVMSNVGLGVSRSTDYDLTDFVTWEKIITEGVLQVRERGVRGQEAMEALRHCHKSVRLRVY
ncbi:hypothetical protein B0J17DRAFT_41268 [Rhizoctonia solani]|nr:hypothetical protein B0J17DRAFT_41268 [Rhizoctonia solani]